MKPINILYYAIAMFLPLGLFLEVFNNLNEQKPALVFLMTVPLWVIAGLLSVPGKVVDEGKTGGKIKWVGWSTFFGVIESLGLIFLV